MKRKIDTSENNIDILTTKIINYNLYYIINNIKNQQIIKNIFSHYKLFIFTL